MENNNEDHNETIISLFNEEINFWTEIYRDDLPKGFFSFEMRQRRKFVIDLLTAQIQTMDNPNVLDCGCGPGDILELIAPLHCRMTGLDINQRYLDLTAEKAPSAVLVQGDVEQLPFPDASFDIVYVVGVLMYLKDDKKAAKEIARVTKDGGFILISVPNYRMLHLFFDPYYIFRFIKNILGKDTQQPNIEFGHSLIRRYSLAKLRNLFKENDLHEIKSLVTSYGPLKFWRKELLPLSTSIRISETIRNWSEKQILSVLKHVGNHLIITMYKGPIPVGKQELLKKANE